MSPLDTPNLVSLRLLVSLEYTFEVPGAVAQFLEDATSPGFDSYHHTKQVWWYVLENPALVR